MFLDLRQSFHLRLIRQCLQSLDEHPYLVEVEETYEPPTDPDSGTLDALLPAVLDLHFSSGLSLEELGLRALQRIPRDRAIDGIRAFNEMR